jgi:hypothetical protein
MLLIDWQCLRAVSDNKVTGKMSVPERGNVGSEILHNEQLPSTVRIMKPMWLYYDDGSHNIHTQFCLGNLLNICGGMHN